MKYILSFMAKNDDFFVLMGGLVDLRKGTRVQKWLFVQGLFKNYVDKMRWVGGHKILLFVHVEVGRVSKMVKILST